MKQEFYTIGKKKSDVEVRISYRIIQLFSEGLYSSPHKAVEELVSNSFDAGATDVHIVLSPDLTAGDATIAVIDNGIGMDDKGLEDHWLIGVSNKRRRGMPLPKDRKQIGKFGIGKLATYVLSERLTHVCKVGSTYYSTSMDYTKIPTGVAGGIHSEDKVFLPLRVLSEDEAKRAVQPWIRGAKPGYKSLRLFGPGAAETWTVAVMSSLKDMASEIQRGRLRWILQSAMPLRDDFNLYLDGERVLPSKLSAARVGHWVLGKDLKELPSPAPEDLEATKDRHGDKDTRYGVTLRKLGRVTGYVEVYEDPLDTGKSTDIERSHGFFVYVRGRLVNIDDPGFGISRNLLRHGTFSRFRMVAHIDRLDDELRSSRESLRAGVLTTIARNLLHGAFNFGRLALARHEASVSGGQQIANRVAGSPGSLTRRPIIGLVRSAFRGKAHPQYVSYPQNLSAEGEAEFLGALSDRAESKEGLVHDVQLVELSQHRGVAVLDVETGILKVNTLHPFVAHFLDEYEDKKRSLPLELLAMSEVLLEAYMYEIGLGDDQVSDVLARRDEALRYLARSTPKHNARLVAQDLIDSSTDEHALETALVVAFDTMGFDAVPLGGKNKPDGLAEARLAADAQGMSHRYSVSLEAKSKNKEHKKVSEKDVNISAIARHRDDYKCEHALVTGPDFPTDDGDASALVKSIKASSGYPNRTITLVRISDLARLVSLVPLKRINLERIRQLLRTCVTPDDSAEWINALAQEKVAKVPYKAILDMIWELQKEQPNETVEYAALVLALRHSNAKIDYLKSAMIGICKNLSGMAPEMVSAREGSVELSQRPDKVLAVIGSVIGEYPEEETKGIQV